MFFSVLKIVFDTEKYKPRHSAGPYIKGKDHLISQQWSTENTTFKFQHLLKQRHNWAIYTDVSEFQSWMAPTTYSECWILNFQPM
jgi:hypothetical protein